MKSVSMLSLRSGWLRWMSLERLREVCGVIRVVEDGGEMNW